MPGARDLRRVIRGHAGTGTVAVPGDGGAGVARAVAASPRRRDVAGFGRSLLGNSLRRSGRRSGSAADSNRATHGAAPRPGDGAGRSPVVGTAQLAYPRRAAARTVVSR